jgi:hypothetical protein
VIFLEQLERPSVIQLSSAYPFIKYALKDMFKLTVFIELNVYAIIFLEYNIFSQLFFICRWVVHW